MTTRNDPQVGDIIKVGISSINPEIGAFATMPNGREKLQTQYNGYIFRYSNAPLSEEEFAAARENYSYRETSKVTSQLIRYEPGVDYRIDNKVF